MILMICFEKVRYLREEQELTQKEVGNILGVDHSTYAGWERGRDLFPLKHLLILADFYKVSLDYITNLSSIRTYKNLKMELNKDLTVQRIREVRKENHYTQIKLAETLNTSHSAISDYERGNRIPPLIILYQLSQLFHVSIDYLLGKTDLKYLEKELEHI